MSIKELLPLSFRERYRTAYQGGRTLLWKFFRLIYRPAFPVNADGTVNLHLGCGGIHHPAFINIDAIADSHIHYIGRIDRLLQFRDSSVDLVYACHCLEHFSHRHVHDVLKEWHRVLKPGGVLRVSVPDFDSMVELYLASGRDIEPVVEPIMGGQNYRYNFHKTIFNEDSLRKAFMDAGFVAVETWIPGSNPLTTFHDWSGSTLSVAGKSFPISLNLQAIK